MVSLDCTGELQYVLHVMVLYQNFGSSEWFHIFHSWEKISLSNWKCTHTSLGTYWVAFLRILGKPGVDLWPYSVPWKIVWRAICHSQVQTYSSSSELLQHITITYMMEIQCYTGENEKIFSTPGWILDTSWAKFGHALQYGDHDISVKACLAFKMV